MPFEDGGRHDAIVNMGKLLNHQPCLRPHQFHRRQPDFPPRIRTSSCFQLRARSYIRSREVANLLACRVLWRRNYIRGQNGLPNPDRAERCQKTPRQSRQADVLRITNKEVEQRKDLMSCLSQSLIMLCSCRTIAGSRCVTFNGSAASRSSRPWVADL